MNQTDISGQLSCVLLAAGGSRRLGRPKALVEFKEESLVSRGVRHLLGLGAMEVLVVTGSDSSNILENIQKYPVRSVRNDDWEQGMGGSIATGVRSLSSRSAAVLILLCDQWKVGQEDLERLADHWSSDISGVFSAKWGDLDDGAFGPPVIFPKSLFSELETLDSDQGARKLIRKCWTQTTFVEMENAAFDLDVPADLNLMREFEAEIRR